MANGGDADTSEERVGADGWVFFVEFEGDGVERGEGGEEVVENATCHMLEGGGRDLHLGLDMLIDFGIGDGAGEVVGLDGRGEIGGEGEVKNESCPHDALLREHTMMGKDADVAKEDLVGHDYPQREAPQLVQMRQPS